MIQSFLVELQNRLQSSSVYSLAELRTSAVTMLPLLKQFEQTEPLAAWMETRLDYLDAAEELKQGMKSQPIEPGVRTASPIPPPTQKIQNLVWTRQIEKHPVPPGAEVYVAQLKPIFAAEKVPPQLVWLAEVESSFNPRARSPAGASGLFQLMRPTGKRLGLSTWLPDERLNPEKSGRAAATHLRQLHDRFGDWRLALAAYNAGEGRVDALLKKARSKRYADIVDRLPSETQMYVPKFEATLKKREGISLGEL